MRCPEASSAGRKRLVSRRAFLSRAVGAIGGLSLGSTLLAACAPTATAPPAASTPAPAKPATSAPGATTAPKPAATTAPAAAPASKAQPAPASTTAPAKPAARRAMLNWGVSVGITRLNPQLSNWRTDVTIYENLFDPLTRRDAELNLVPGLATEWKLLNDTTWQFKLRPNVKFHNGDPLTAADVKFTIERTYDPEAKTLVATVFTTVARIETPDDLTVNFVTKEPDPLFPARHAWNGGHVLPAKYFQQVGPDEFEKRPIGTGPYKFVEYVKDDHLTLEANSDYWGGAPNASGMRISPKPEAASRVASLLAGDVNFVDEIPPDLVDQITTAPDLKVVDAAISGLNMVAINTDVAPLGNKLVRQALSLAVDRDALIKDLLRGKAIVANGWIPKGDFGYDPSLPALQFQPQKARDLLAQAGYTGEEIVFETLQVELALTEAIVAMWKDVGINSKIEVLEASVRAQKLRDRSWKGVYAYFALSPMGDPDAHIWRLFGPGAGSRFVSDPEWDRLGAEAHSSLDQDLRRKNYQRMNQIFLDLTPQVVLFQPLRSYGMHRSIEWRAAPTGVMDFRKENLSFTG